MFRKEDLPKEVQDKIEYIEFSEEEEDEEYEGTVYITESYELYWDHSHCESFKDMDDLINILTMDVVPVETREGK